MMPASLGATSEVSWATKLPVACTVADTSRVMTRIVETVGVWTAAFPVASATGVLVLERLQAASAAATKTIDNALSLMGSYAFRLLVFFELVLDGLRSG